MVSFALLLQALTLLIRASRARHLEHERLYSGIGFRGFHPESLVNARQVCLAIYTAFLVN